jgi:hypothetical protein
VAIFADADVRHQEQRGVLQWAERPRSDRGKCEFESHRPYQFARYRNVSLLLQKDRCGAGVVEGRTSWGHVLADKDAALSRRRVGEEGIVDGHTRETALLAGLLEGEGSFMAGPPSSPRSPIVHMVSTDEDVVRKAANLTGASYRKGTRGADKGWRPTYTLRVRGGSAIELMTKLRPMMSERRTQQIDRAVACYAPRRPQKLSDEDVAAARATLEGGAFLHDVAERFGISISTASRIKGGRRQYAKYGPVV